MKGWVFLPLLCTVKFQIGCVEALDYGAELGNNKTISFWIAHLWSTEGVVVLVLIKLHNQWESSSG